MVIGTCCRILPSKRIEYLVEMLAELDRRLPGVRMILVGAGSSKYEEYWRFIQKRIQALGVTHLHFAGHQGNVVSYLRRFRVFVLLGSDHGCPNASLEAMSLGLPIVATKHGGTGEQVEQGVNGFLVSERNPREMAHRIRMLLTNPAKREIMGKASRRIVHEKFTMESMVRRYGELLGYKTNGASQRKKVQS